MEIRTQSRRTATDEGEFETRADAAAWVAGAVLAFDGAEDLHIHIERRRRGLGWPPYLRVSLEAEWPAVTSPEPRLPPVDVTAVRDALVEAAHALREEP